MRSGYRERHPFTSLIVGAISGLAGTVVMTQFQNMWNKLIRFTSSGHTTSLPTQARKKVTHCYSKQ